MLACQVVCLQWSVVEQSQRIGMRCVVLLACLKVNGRSWAGAMQETFARRLGRIQSARLRCYDASCKASITFSQPVFLCVGHRVCDNGQRHEDMSHSNDLVCTISRNVSIIPLYLSHYKEH